MGHFIRKTGVKHFSLQTHSSIAVKNLANFARFWNKCYQQGRFFFGGSTSSWMCHPRMWTTADSGRSLARATQRTRWYLKGRFLEGSLRDNQWWRHPLNKAFLFLRKGWWLFLGKGTFFWVSWWCDDGTWDVNISYPVPYPVDFRWYISTNSCESWPFWGSRCARFPDFSFEIPCRYHCRFSACRYDDHSPPPLQSPFSPLRWFADVLFPVITTWDL